MKQGGAYKSNSQEGINVGNIYSDLGELWRNVQVKGTTETQEGRGATSNWRRAGCKLVIISPVQTLDVGK